MTALLFIRHAETAAAGTFCGHSDPPVNADGQQQIAQLLQQLHGQSFAAVYTSDLRRALTTAEALAEAFNLPYTSTPALREINFGAWEGRTWNEIIALDPAYAARWAEKFPDLPAPGGEYFASFRARVLTEVDRIQSQCGGGPSLIVTHAGVIRTVMVERCGLSASEAWQLTRPYCSTFPYKPVRQAAAHADP